MRFIFVLCLWFPFAAFSGPICGKIVSLKGQLDILSLKAGDSDVRVAKKAKKKMKFLCSDVLVTGTASRAKVRFVNKSVLSMGPDSRIEVLKFAVDKNKVDTLGLTYGKVRAYFKKAPAAEKSSKNSVDFKIKTPTAVAGVRGTDFYVGFNPNTQVTEQATLTGKVEVESLATQQKVVVEPGKQVTVNATKTSLEKDLLEKDLKPEPIQKRMAEEIRHTSTLVKKDKEFTTKQAIAVLGTPETWVAPDLPEEFKNIKEEF